MANGASSYNHSVPVLTYLPEYLVRDLNSRLSGGDNHKSEEKKQQSRSKISLGAGLSGFQQQRQMIGAVSQEVATEEDYDQFDGVRMERLRPQNGIEEFNEYL